ncbi:MAG TPA: hypothetical protein PK514_15930 [Spirochaetota bacterium]|nr:hypothetical protein [Spirochaetota bacterium]
MPNDLETAASNFSEQSRKHQIALYYTMGDQDKAKKMVTGGYTDLYVIKCIFSSSSVYGGFIVFINTAYLKAVSGYIIVTRSFDLVDVKTTKDWRTFEKILVETAKKGEHDEVFSNQIRDGLIKALTLQEVSNLSKLLEQDNGIAINRYMQRFISSVAGLQNMELKADYEQISSLAMELHSFTSAKIQPDEFTKGQGKDQTAEVEIEKNEDALAGKDVKLILNGALILSPLKGKEISRVTAGDRIMISLVDKNPRTIDVAKAFNAYDSDKGIRPIPGRVVSIKLEGYYTIYAIVAKGIYVKIIEEEPLIKIAMDPAHYLSADGGKDDEKSVSGITLAVLAFVFLALVGVVLFFVFGM